MVAHHLLDSSAARDILSRQGVGRIQTSFMSCALVANSCEIEEGFQW